MNEHLELTEMQKCQQIFSRLCHDAGLLDYQIQRMQGDLENLRVKIRNAAIDYDKAKKAETPTHLKEVTESQGVTQ
jgi:hypothetical protein